MSPHATTQDTWGVEIAARHRSREIASVSCIVSPSDYHGRGVGMTIGLNQNTGADGAAKLSIGWSPHERQLSTRPCYRELVERDSCAKAVSKDGASRQTVSRSERGQRRPLGRECRRGREKCDDGSLHEMDYFRSQ